MNCEDGTFPNEFLSTSFLSNLDEVLEWRGSPHMCREVNFLRTSLTALAQTLLWGYIGLV